ncbi:uncharacterized protein LOC111697597 [Eurytemora carolleeae]|uniref:uncharacterized protein LOC111697597 n=1 Tax=Eurytemora carolleeae TaxID=1294199 RepID=UPI000C78B971|nr:uncharacterized protein LOC111697597 [Eurytemora carolleeae]|eukprot:XP_023323416.1 uncharacterized protein LOC111697597 [Eurytemora affinis]
MTEEDQPVIDLDGRNGDRIDYTATEDKYRSTDLPTSPVQTGRGRLASLASQGTTRTLPTAQLEVKLPWYKSVTWKDIRDILPTLIILLVGLLIMVIVIPYAFSSVIKQLQQEQELNRLREELELNKTESDKTKNLE